MMQHSNDTDTNNFEFTTSIDSTVTPNVPPPTNNVLQNMLTSQTNKSSISQVNQNQPLPTPAYTPTLPGFSYLTHSSHPTACFFHIFFKASAFTLYLLGSRFMEDIMVTVLCILLAAADFWVVKNITGRLLVGLRWWNKVDPVTGATSWIFESAVPQMEGGPAINAFDSKFFWTFLYATPFLWTFFCITAILWFQFQCFVTLACALVLSSSNVYGYYMCSKDQRERVKELMDQGVAMGVGAMVRGGMFGRLFGGGAGRGAVQTVDTMPGTFA